MSNSTRILTQQLDDAVKSIKKRISFNTWIYGITLVVVGIILWRLIAVSMEFNQSAQLASQNAINIATLKTNQELYRDQYLSYIRDMIDSMNALQANNPHMNIPKAPVPRPLGIPQNRLTDEDLRRLPQPGPTPSPIIKTKTIVKIKKLRSPTPKPFKDWFKSTR